MAESVQTFLESLVPELRDLEEKKLFTKAEIKSMIKKRTDFEYALRRRTPQKSDFIKYLQYEQALEVLRKKRVRRVGPDYRPSLCDHAWKQRLHSLFNRALRKFPGDKPLWAQYIVYAQKTDASKALGSIFTRAIQLHPRDPTFWVMAARWEMHHNANLDTARKLFQRALSLNPDSEELYVQFFRMEVRYTRRLIRRRNGFIEKAKAAEALLNTGDDSGSDDDDGDSDSDGDGDGGEVVAGGGQKVPLNIPQLDVEGKTAASKLALAVDKNEEIDDPHFQYALPAVIYKEAIQHIPNSLAFRQRFIKIAATAPNTAALLSTIYDSLIYDFPGDVEAESLVLRRPLYATLYTDPAYPFALKKVIESYNLTLQAGGSTTEYRTSLMVSFVSFLWSLHEDMAERNLQEYLKLAIANAFETAVKLKIVSSALLEAFFTDYAMTITPDLRPQLLAQIKQLEAPSTRLVSQLVLLEPTAENVALAERHTRTSQDRAGVYANVVASWVTAPPGSADDCIERFSNMWKTLHRLPPATAQLQQQAVDTARQLENEKAQLVQRYLQVVNKHFGPTSLLAAGKRILDKTPFRPLTLLQAVVTVYMLQLPATYADIKQLFELGLQAPEGAQNIEWWIGYLELESSQKHFTAAMQLFWRAKKALGESEELNYAWERLKQE
ncbi:U3 snoRNP protein [Sorochytrium milnesiophthora]